MMRAVLSFTLGSMALATGLRCAFLQAQNFDSAAELHRLQMEIEWYERRITGLRASIERAELEAHLEDQQQLLAASDAEGLE